MAKKGRTAVKVIVTEDELAKLILPRAAYNHIIRRSQAGTSLALEGLC